MEPLHLLCDNCWHCQANTCHNEKIASVKQVGLSKKGEYISLGLLERCHMKSCYRNRNKQLEYISREKVLV